MFLCIEGIDGVGKTTMAAKLCVLLNSSYYKSFSGPFLRAAEHLEIDEEPLTSYFFYRASIQRDSNNIKLLGNNDVVADRYVYSNIAYHVALHEKIREIVEFTDIVLPDAVVLLVCGEEERRRRLAGRANVEAFETDIAYLRKVEKILKEYACMVIDTTAVSPDEIADAIVSQLRGG